MGPIRRVKRFFEVIVGGEQCVKLMSDTLRIYRGGHRPHIPRFPNSCSGWLGYLGKVKSPR